MIDLCRFYGHKLSMIEGRILSAREAKFSVVRRIYLLSCRDTVKIGVSANVAARVRLLQKQNPFDIEIVRVWKHFDAVVIERLAHAHFQARRLNGEWFAVSPAEAESVISGIIANYLRNPRSRI